MFQVFGVRTPSVETVHMTKLYDMMVSGPGSVALVQ